jgi:hypothetical protein
MPMKVAFQTKDRTKILSSIKEQMSGRKLGEMVDIALAGGHLTVTISKLGTSTLEFKEKETDAGLDYTLEREKIAFTHKAFKDEVTQKIVKVIESAGGKVTA